MQCRKPERHLDHTKSYLLRKIEQTVLNGLAGELASPEGLKVYLAEYHNEMRRLARDISKRQGSLERERARAAAAIDRLVDRLADGTVAPPIAKAKLDELVATRDQIDADLAVADSEYPKISIHPKALAGFQATVDALRLSIARAGDASNTDDLTNEKLHQSLRDLISCVQVRPGEIAMIEVIGKIAALVGYPSPQYRLAVVPQEGFEPPTYALRKLALSGGIKDLVRNHCLEAA